MSVQSEITRLETAKASIVAAIEGKGVTVPSGAKLDALAALIESIEAGGGGSGGLPSPFTNITTGTFRLASLSYANAYPITHGLGVAPKVFLIFTDEPGSYSGGAINHLSYIDDANTYVTKILGYANQKNNVAGWTTRDKVLVDENTFTFNESAYYFGTKKTYRWVAIG